MREIVRNIDPSPQTYTFTIFIGLFVVDIDIILINGSR